MIPVTTVLYRYGGGGMNFARTARSERKAAVEATGSRMGMMPGSTGIY